MRNRISLIVLVGVAMFAVSRMGFGEALVSSDRAVDGETSQVIETSFEQLEFDPGEEFRRMLVPKNIDALDGKRVRIRGDMWPTFKRDGIQRFVLLNNGRRMSFGAQQSAPYEAIRVTVKDGYGASFSRRRIIVEGKLHVDPLKGGSDYISLYRLENATVLSHTGAGLIAPLEETTEDDSTLESSPQSN